MALIDYYHFLSGIPVEELEAASDGAIHGRKVCRNCTATISECECTPPHRYVHFGECENCAVTKK